MPQVLRRFSASLQRRPLRQRILLLFGGLSGCAALALALGLYLGYLKHDNPWALDALTVGGVLSGCIILALIGGLWWLFDEHVAKPLERLAGELRARTHAAVNADLTDMQARHLGDLAPAATALIRHLNESRNALAEAIARETTQQVIEKERLMALLSELPIGVLICSAEHRLALYNGLALEMLGEIGVNPGAADTAPRLGRPVFDYLEEDTILQAHDELRRQGLRDAALPLVCTSRDTSQCFHARIRLLGDAPARQPPSSQGYVLTLHPMDAGMQATVRSLVYDFSLLDQGLHPEISDTPLQALTYVVFDTETTGLLPGSGDEIVQLAAVRIVNGRRIATEVFNSLVNPGRPIPPSSTRIHGISDDMVAGAPGVQEVVRRFHKFAQGAVLVAHNANFDMAFLQRHETRTGLRFDHPLLDTVLLSALIFGDAEHHSLDALAARLGIALPAAARHTALGDATATADALLKLLPALQGKGLTNFGELQAECQRHSRLLRSRGTA